MDKKQKHLILFTNYEQLNFVNIHHDRAVKAYTILFHFKNKSQDSQLFEEFNSVVLRNTKNKTKSHEKFASFYRKMTKISYELGFKSKLQTRCSKSGWPIDLEISSLEGSSRKMALFFLLQEEMCYNLLTRREEPLALQRLMLKHIKTISGVKVNYVTEN